MLDSLNSTDSLSNPRGELSMLGIRDVWKKSKTHVFVDVPLPQYIRNSLQRERSRKEEILGADNLREML